VYYDLFNLINIRQELVMPQQSQFNISRRSFLRTTAMASTIAALGPNILPAQAANKKGIKIVRPSNKIHVACIGIGWQVGHNMGQFLQNPDVRVVAVCDLDQNHLERAKNTVNRTYEDEACAIYSDYREMFENEDIDAVSLGLPDHWHAIPAIAAAKKGYDVWGEKPFSHTLVEGRAMVKAIEKNNCIWQTGSWQRSVPNFHRAAELVRNGRIGKVTHIEVGLGSGHSHFSKDALDTEIKAPPAHLDYKTWCGPSGKQIYAKARVHKHWRWVMAHGGGQLMDWIGHHGDIAHWGVGLDYSGPVKIKGTGVRPIAGLWDAPVNYDCQLEYADGMTMSVSGKNQMGTKWIGTDGWIFVTRGNSKSGGVTNADTTSNDNKILQEQIGDDEIKLYKSTNHWKNFIDCVKSREETITPAEIAHRSASIGHLCNIAMYTGREINFDPKKERIIDDREAHAMLSPDYARGYRLR
jgi:predicted dehydrogenase